VPSRCPQPPPSWLQAATRSRNTPSSPVSPKPGRDALPDVASLRPEAFIAQAAHQFGPQPGDLPTADAGRCRRVGEAESGEGRHDHVEGVGRVAPVALRVGEQRDEAFYLDGGRCLPGVADRLGFYCQAVPRNREPPCVRRFRSRSVSITS
jgi:hypothetical protein